MCPSSTVRGGRIYDHQRGRVTLLAEPQHPRRPRRHPLHFTADVLQAVLATVQQAVVGILFARRAAVAQVSVGEGFDRVGTGGEGGMILSCPVRLATPRVPDRR